jgi:4'-phosphopantetheinyl transferase
MRPERSIAVPRVDTWVVRLDEPQAAVSSYPLSADEIERAAQFVFDLHRRRYVNCRRALRSILSTYVGVPPERLVFAYGERGKPALAGGSPWHFNVSHSEDLALVAVTTAGPVGVDVESIDRDVDIEGLGERFFSMDECADLFALTAEARREAFFNCWTRKEAYIKAIGDGLACPLDSFAVTIRPHDRPAMRWIHGDEARDWCLRAATPRPRFAAAVAVRCADFALLMHDWAGAPVVVSAVPHDTRGTSWNHA